jgi:hypothetical protein
VLAPGMWAGGARLEFATTIIHPGGSDRLPFSCFRLQDHHRSGPKPQGRLRRPVHRQNTRFRWHPACEQQGQPLGCEGVFVWGRSPGELYLSPAAAARVQEPVMLLPVGLLHHGTPKQDGVGKALQRDSRLCANNRQGERTIHLPTQDRGLSGPCSVRGCLAARNGHGTCSSSKKAFQQKNISAECCKNDRKGVTYAR